MKFVDEALIRVHAGHGGHGCMSFLRERCRPRGGPDGGDGGRGGDVVVVADPGLNTLADFRYTRVFRAARGAPGAGGNRAGRQGEDRVIRLPAATVVSDADTGETLFDMVRAGPRRVVARGGRGGLGNARFKSSVNRAPRRVTPGRPGEEWNLKLELRVLADVGLLGLPNAGKSTLLRAVSAARPKVADYPFTTLHPELGVVDAGPGSGFVVADVPGLIEGAARGAGLGVRFLNHLRRTRLLLHVVDLSGSGLAADPVHAVRSVHAELEAFGHGLDRLPQWLVFNKCDALAADAARAAGEDAVRRLGWRRPRYWISALSGAGCARLIDGIMHWLDAREACDG